MKKKFTFLIAALALLTMINLPGKAVGQNFTLVYTLTPEISSTAASTAYNQAYDFTIDGITWNVTGNTSVNPWRIGGKKSTIGSEGTADRTLYSKGTISDNVSKIVVTHENSTSDITVNSMTLIVSTSENGGGTIISSVSGEYVNNSSTTFLRPENVDWTGRYYKIVYNVTNTTTTQKYLLFAEAAFYKDAGSNAPSLSVTPSSIGFGSVAINPSPAYEETFEVSFANLTQDLSVSVGSGLTGVSVSPTTISQNATSPASVTVSYNPTAEGTLNGDITVSNTADNLSETVAVTGSAYDPANIRYYEKVTTASANWSGEYIFTGINSSEYYALTGVSSSLGTTAQVTVTENGIQSTSTTDGYKVTVAQTTNGYSLYLAGAGYLYYSGSSNNLYAAQTFTANTCEWNISFASGVATITNVNNSARKLQFNYNTGNPRFACYSSSNQTNITLFKYNDPNKVKTPTFSPEGGEYVAAQSVEISSETSGASIYYTTDGSTPTTASTPYTSAFTVSSTTTVKAIAVKSGMTDSDVASTTYTFVTPFTTMQQVYEDAVANTSEHEVYITFNNWVITGTNGSSASQFYLTDPDNTYGCVIYGSGSGFAKGNTLNGTVKCKLLYFSSGSSYSFAEIKELTTETAGLTVGTGGNVMPITTTIDALTSAKTGTVVKLENLTYNGTVLTDNNNNIINNSNYIYSATLTANKTYDVTGVFIFAYAQNGTPKKICPRNSDDVEESVVSTITLASASVPANADNCTMAINDNMSATSFTIMFFNEAGTTQIEKPSWIDDALIAEENGAYMVSCTFDPNTGAERKAYLRVASSGVTSNLATLTQAKYIPNPTNDPYVRIGSLDYLTDGSIVVIAARYNGTANAYYAMSNTTSGKPTGVAFTSDAEKLPASIVNDEDDYYWVVNVTNGEYTFTKANGEMIGYGTSGTDFVTNTNTAWTIERATSDEKTMVGKYTGFVIKNANTNTRAFALNTSHNFGPYAISTNATSSSYNFYLDFFVQTADETYDLPINGYTSQTNGWNLIASPVATTPSEVTNMTSNTYDLYRFNQSATDYWENYKATDNNQQIIHTDFNIIPGQGYLYANSSNQVNLTFTGTPYRGNGTIDLVFDANAPEKVRGLNLVGNPYATNATVDKDFYIMNETGTDVLINALDHEQNTVARMQGIFVKATAAGQTVTFTPVNSSNSNSNNNKPAVVMNLSQNRGSVIDRTIVRFGDSDNMPKFQLFETNTKLSLVQDNEEYAIVSAGAQGEMPVNFKANQSGEYTISVNTTEVEMTYLHLIDNLTGADVDLLATPSYTFNARNDDYASRFRLVFSANSANENGNDNFAFISDGQIILTEQGDVQVYDVMGRMISSHNNVNHFAAEGLAAGVYVIRLTNGNDVKTQKIVVK